MKTMQDITQGRRLRQVDLEGVSISEVTYSPGTCMPPHAHRNPNVSLVIQGDFEEQVDGQSYRLGACALVLKPAGTVHSNQYGPRGARSMVIEFSPAATSRDWFEAGAGERCRWIQSGPGVTSALRTYWRVLRQPDPASAAQELLEGVIEILAFSRRDGGAATRPRWRQVVGEARQLLRDSFQAAPSSRQIAAQVGVHPVYLARVFRQHYHCSMSEYRRRLQLAEAARRLMDTTEPLSMVAAATGFADQSHLTRAFRQALGVTPGRYRRSCRSGPGAG